MRPPAPRSTHQAVRRAKARRPRRGAQAHPCCAQAGRERRSHRPIAPSASACPLCAQVVISSRLTASPCALVTASHGWSAGMERFLAAHAARDASDAASAGGATTPLLRTARKSLEINQRHPVIAELARRAAARPHDPAVRELALLLYETALLDSGFALEEPAAFTRRVHQAILLGLENADTATAAPSDADDRSR